MLISLFVSTVAATAFPSILQEADAPPTPATVLDGMEFREVGPYRGGRAAAVCGLESDPMTYYMGSAGGGVWKTTNGGTSWNNISDETFGGSIGSIAVSEWDPNVIYVGGGEKTVRGNVGHGDGLWRSEDAGRTWKAIGLEDSQHIPRIRIHPRDPDTAWAAVLGHLYGPHPTRGVYKTTDSGKTWEQKLFVNEDSGCVDLSVDPSNPRIMFASFWTVRRTPYSLSSGGEGSSLWKSIDGGETWDDISANDGMPEGPLGISGVSVSGANSDIVYAVIEAKDGGVFRSRDGGDSWSRTNTDRSLRQRAWYYSRLQADPVDADTVYVLNVGMHRSTDGGKKFERMSTPHGDNHDLWIAPSDPSRMIESNDGGANVSFDGGKSWSEQSNQPTSQMYRVSVDTATPYRLLGGQQDNSAVRIRVRSSRGGRPGVRDWEPTAGGESGHVVAHPSNPDLVFGGSYGGFLSMVDHANSQRRSVTVWPDNPMGYGAEGMRYRFQWNFPLFFSPHGDADAAPESEESYPLYAASNVLFRSRDLGASWEQISPDLTRNDPTRLGPSGGPITKDNTGVEYYCTIFAAFESPLQKGVIWCGSDDGRVHVTVDDGATWSEVTPEGLPEWTQINDMVADPFTSGGAYLAGTRYKLDDFRPYLYHTTDFGATWTEITSGIPDDHFTRAIEVDAERRGLLFAGTERGLYVSMNDGASWDAFQQGLPIVPVTDLAFGGSDLVVATQGRGYWVLDNIAALRQLSLSAHVGNSVLFAPDDATRAGYAGGVDIDYLVAEGVEDLKLTIKDYDGNVIREFVPKGKAKKAPHAAEKDDVLPNDEGYNRFSWNLRAKGAESFPDMILWSGRMTGPKVPPGRYRIELDVDGETVTVPLLLTADPRSSSTTMDLVEQYNFVVETGELLTRAHTAVRNIRSLSKDMKALKKRLPDGDENATAKALTVEIDAALEAMKGVEEALYQTKNQSRQDPLNFPIQLTDKLAGVRSGAMSGEFAPTAQMGAVAKELGEKIEAQLAVLDELLSTKVPAIDEAARGLALPIVTVPD